MYVTTDWVYRSSTLTTAYKSVESYVAPLLLGGLRIGYINYDHDYDISAYVRNIANTIQPVGVAIDFIPNDKNAIINDPRTFGIQIKKHF
jgi:iron complex outermembrane receptor protein